METVTYYAMLLEGDAHDNPSGIARRGRHSDGGLTDEVLTSDLTWSQTPLIAGWKRGDTTFDFVEISKDDATDVMDRLKERWGAAQ